MIGYVGKRLATGILTIFATICISFLLIHLAPGNPIAILSGQANPSPSVVHALEAQYGLNKPIAIQFVSYVMNLLHGNLGQSIAYGRPVLGLIGHRIGPTLLLTFPALVLSVLIGVSLGVYCARHIGGKLDVFLNTISYVFDSMPSFWLGMIFVLIFASWLNIFPTAGMVNVRDSYTGFSAVLDVLNHLVLPVSTLTLLTIPYYFRIARASVIQVMTEDFVLTLRATGMSERRIFNKYVLKNAILPVITVVGISLAFIITGVAIIEIVFNWPGMGSLMLHAIENRDYLLLMGIYIVISVSVALIMIVVDTVYAFVDPRIRHK